MFFGFIFESDLSGTSCSTEIAFLSFLTCPLGDERLEAL
jgi:hypothetical protein